MRTWAAELAFFELEGEDIEEAVEACGSRLEQGLFLNRGDIEMKAQKIHQVRATQSPLDERLPGRRCVVAEVVEEQLAQAFERFSIDSRRGLDRAPLDLGLAIGAFATFAHDPELADPFQHQVVAPVVQFDELGYPPRASDGESIGVSVVVAFPIAFEEHHADDAVGGGYIGDHLAIARLKDMQRNRNSRKQNQVGKREKRNNSG